MRHFLTTIAVALFCATAMLGQATNDGFLSLTVNGEDGGAPNFVQVLRPSSFDLEIAGTPNVAFALGYSPMVSVGTIFVGGIQIDLGGPIQLVMNGISPTALVDFFAFTGPPGSATFSLSVGFQFPTGILGGFQAIAVDASAPGGISDTAATEVTIVAPLDYGSITYLRGNDTANTDIFGAQTATGKYQLSIPSSNIDVEGLNLVDYTYMVPSINRNIFARRNPAVFGPQGVANNSTFDHIQTIHGALYAYEDNTTDEWAFALAQSGGVPPVEIAGTRIPNPGSTTVSPYEDDIAITADQSTMAVVYDPSGGGADRMLLIKLDGTNFASTATPVVDVTPAVGPTLINETTMHFAGGFLYFTDSGSIGTLYSAPADGSALATTVTFPMTGTGLPVTGVDDQSFLSAANDLLIVQAGNSSSNEDIYAISHAGGLATVTNVTNFPLPIQIEEFGDSYDGMDGQISVSPDGSRVAFVTIEAADDELYWVTTDGLGTPQILTDATQFETALDDVLHLNFYDNNNIIAFCGSATNTLDGYNFDLSLAPAVTLSNLTQTNGQDGSVLPITAVPSASIDHDGYVALPDRMIFLRDGTQALGASAGDTTAHNIVGIVYATKTVYDITGDEFSGGPADPQQASSATSHQFTFTDSSIVWFKSGTGGTTNATDEELYYYDTTVTGKATKVSSFGGLSADIGDIIPDASGGTCYFTFRPGASLGDEEVYLANFGVPGVTQLTSDASTTSDITRDSINIVPSGGGTGFVFAQGTLGSSTNPTDANLLGYDVTTGLITVIDDAVDPYHIMGISFP